MNGKGETGSRSGFFLTFHQEKNERVRISGPKVRPLPFRPWSATHRRFSPNRYVFQEMILTTFRKRLTRFRENISKQSLRHDSPLAGRA